MEGDVDSAAGQLVVQQVACGVIPWGGSPRLGCLPGEVGGTVRGVILAGCPASWLSPEQARAELVALLADRPRLSSVADNRGSYTAVLTWPAAPDRTLVLSIGPAGVVAFAADCGPRIIPEAGHALKLGGVVAR